MASALKGNVGCDAFSQDMINNGRGWDLFSGSAIFRSTTRSSRVRLDGAGKGVEMV